MMAAADKILKDTANRQFPLPEGKWQSYQEWHNVVMLHWRVPLDYIVEMLPPGLTLDTFEGEAWVSWLGFSVKNMRYRGLPPIPYFSNFEEVNLRTYVKCNGRPGIYMLSVEANKFLNVLLTRLVSGIPYIKSEIRRKPGFIGIANGVHHFNAHINYGYTEPLGSKTVLDYWLTERHSLYISEKGKLYRYDIHHREWKLNGMIVSAASLKYKLGMFNIGKQVPQKKHYARKIKVLLWGRKEVENDTVMGKDKKDTEKYRYHQNLKENEKEGDNYPDKPDNHTTTEERLINPKRGEK